MNDSAIYILDRWDLPHWLLVVVRQARIGAGDSRMGMVVFNAGADSVVALAARDFRELLGQLGDEGKPTNESTSQSCR